MARPRARPTLDELAAGGVCVLGFVMYLHYARTWDLGYDEAMHVFISTVQPFEHFLAALRMEAHPPLHYLLLRLLMSPSQDLLAPRLASIVPGVVGIGLMFLCARTMRVARPLALLLALAFAIAPAHLNLAVCSRAYSLATMFTLLAYLCYLRALRDSPQENRAAVVGFVAASLLAMASEYSAALVVFGAIVVLAVHRVRVRNSSVRCRIPEIVTFGVGVVAIAAYRHWTTPVPYNHLVGFFLTPDERPLDYAVRGVATSLTSLLAPLALPSGRWLLALLLVLAMAWSALTHRYLAASSAHRDRLRGSALMLLAGIWVMLFVLGCAGWYPFGGKMRHQFVLFPFLLFAPIFALDEIHRRLAPRPRMILCLVATALIVGASRQGLAGAPLEEFPGGPFWKDEIDAVRAAWQPGDVLYTGYYDSVGVFVNFRDWRWTHRDELASRYDRFTVDHADRYLSIVRDRQWVVPVPPTPAFVADVADLLRATGMQSLWVLALPQESFDRARTAGYLAEPALARLWATQGVQLDRRLLFDTGVAFRLTMPSTHSAAHPET